MIISILLYLLEIPNWWKDTNLVLRRDCV